MKDRVLHEKVVYKTIREAIDSLAKQYGPKNAFRYRLNPHDKDTVVKTYDELRLDICALGTELASRGYSGKHVALIGKSSYSWVITYYATMAVGCVLVPLDKDWSAAELADTLNTADAEVVICDREQSSKIDAIREATGITDYYLIGGGEGETLDTLVKLGAEKFASDTSIYYDAKVNPDALSLLVFTSGTTGKGKGVMLTQTNFLTDIPEVIPYMDYTEKTIHVLPPHHTFGSCISIFGQTSLGTEIYISSGNKYILRELQEQKPGHLIVVPLYVETFYRKIVSGIKATGKEKLIYALMKVSNLLRRVGIDLRRKLFGKILEPFGGELRMMISGGAPLNQDIVDLFDSIGVTILNGYGITECAPVIAVSHSYYVIKKCVGTVLSIDDVKIDDPNEDGEGEILVKGSNVMLGYYKNPEATRDAFDEDGYFRTGDYGKLEYDAKNDNRNLFITGRKKNLIILANGKNVYPEEIEDALSATPGVLELVAYEGKSRRGDAYNTIVLEIFPDKDFVEKNKIDNLTEYFQPFVNEYNKTAVPYKKIGLMKVREEEFPKNTLRKIMRFKMDMTID